jgi:hypothetical protein
LPFTTQSQPFNFRLEFSDPALTSSETKAADLPEEPKDSLPLQSANQFATLLIVLALFFTVLLGVWSPLLTKEQLSHASTAAAVKAESLSGDEGGVSNFVGEDEEDFLADDQILTGQINNSHLTARSRTGSTIELTKVSKGL